MSVRCGTIQAAMQEAGVRRTDPQWDETLYSCAPFSPDGRAVYTFRPYGPRPLVADVTHVRPAVPPP